MRHTHIPPGNGKLRRETEKHRENHSPGHTHDIGDISQTTRDSEHAPGRQILRRATTNKQQDGRDGVGDLRNDHGCIDECVECCHQFSEIHLNQLNEEEGGEVPVVEQTYTTPNSITTTPLNTSAYTGTFSVGCTRHSHFDPNSALSRANDQVIRDAVWCTAFRATKVTVNIAAMNTVLPMGESRACVHSW